MSLFLSVMVVVSLNNILYMQYVSGNVICVRATLLQNSLSILLMSKCSSKQHQRIAKWVFCTLQWYLIYSCKFTLIEVISIKRFVYIFPKICPWHTAAIQENAYAERVNCCALQCVKSLGD